ncbi:sugar ABC transporter ATP-binding protein [Argonema galeatum]|uniref:sugar ABC transporter ATP-binding protein n=1 Tax=Argonema galeatum TaxID=2942762 RepID=UPI002011079A|nr:sugar ABC transporter ATP-binding protein [Argonema galeatum]MCL1468262.1 sugar ABC transporter ATP-binding protein [Argonema galeatum A003/A1]
MVSSTQASIKTKPVLEMQDITKTFHGFTALHDVNLTIYPGEVHALMGENGAGKSTLMKILAGAYIADGGEIRIDGQAVKMTDPGQARDLGIAIIYQELNLAPNLTVAENIFMGSELTKGGNLIDQDGMRRKATEVLENLNASFDAGDLVSTLSIAEQQQVEIARALKDKSRILVMDEPTAALSDRETEKLFEVVRRLRNEGIAIIYISHRMAEIYALADRVSAIRDGGYIGSLEKSEISAARLVEMMVGRSLQDLYEHKRQTTPGPVVLEVTNLSDGRKVKPASFRLHAGEIVGLAGLVGAGRTELARLIFGADRRTSGEIKLEGRPLNISEPSNAIESGIAYVPEDIKNKRPLNILTPDDAIEAGIAYVPEDRKNLGLFLDMTSGENITLNVLDRETKAGIINSKNLAKVVTDAIKDLGIRLASPSIRAMDLSGGNQQKLLLARWLAINPKVLLLDEPTRGVDIGAKSEIYRIISDLAAKGVAILMISSELPEIVGMSGR